MCSYSEDHKRIGKIVEQVVSKNKNIEAIKRELRTFNISGEYFKLANCEILNVFTGSSAYDIVGYSIIKKGHTISIEEAYN